MTPAEARHFLETCNDEIEAGMTDALYRKILAARAIVIADAQARQAAETALCRAALRADRRARAKG